MNHCNRVTKNLKAAISKRSRFSSTKRTMIWRPSKRLPITWLLSVLLLFWCSAVPRSRECMLGGQGLPFAYALTATTAAKREESESSLEAQKQDANNPHQSTGLTKPASLNQILVKAGKRGLGGGIPGAIAGVVQVLTLMWMRTIINYQSRYGASFSQAFENLRNDGGIRRFYRGLWFALIQAPLSRFVSTASNDGVEAFMSNFEPTKEWGPGRTTVVASIIVGIWRMFLMPIDTCKTVLQVDSGQGFRNLMRRVKSGKIGLLYQGAIANAISSVMGHYPWFYTYNTLNKNAAVIRLIPMVLLRNAAIGFTASIVSDTVVNAVRVVKTTKQSMGSKHTVGYMDTIRMILASDGWKGLFGRGLKTRIWANAIQSIIFTVMWRALVDLWADESTSNLQNKAGDDEASANDDETISSLKQ